ncbi:zinc ribbon domain-containing protein [Eggerthella sp. YY7918]|uniref:zinc ribbon domain-containing protein n=1 Tax=Eggerthella sp. (strain YY7918) TaxID=502558 RepID=UPI0002170EBE|nr:zinc ribbon domain-containing protein [Eggerthella sp. YY7918]BAK43616.1 predicted nucleic-acid-binding protein containing a Zn-ribbon domain [Eggerthella sp. YY7918]
MGFKDEFNRGLTGDDRYEMAGIIVTCSHCGGEEFDERSVQLNTTGATFLGLDWANRNATVLVCKNCGHLEWFL